MLHLACLIVQRALFGQEPLEASHSNAAAMAMEGRVEQPEQTLMPLLDRAKRTVIGALDQLEAWQNGKPTSNISIGNAGQVNVGGVVNNQI